MDKVFYYKVSDYASEQLSAVIEKIFEGSDAAKTLTEKTKVLLKPNLLAKHKPSAAVTTHPAVVKAVIEALARRGVTDITLADSPGGVYRPELMKSIYEVSGLAEVCRNAGVKLYTECKWQPLHAQGKLCRLWNIIDPVIGADFIINLPKVKTHMMMGMSCAVKNLFGCIPGLQKAELHMQFPEKEPFAAMLCDLHGAIKPQMNIADGILSMEGDGPAGGIPRKTGVILASDNAYAVDLAVCAMIGFETSGVPYMKEAISRGICAESLDLSAIVGDSFEPIPDYKLPNGYKGVNFSDGVPKLFSWAVPMVQRAVAPRPVIKKSACIGCAKCAEICPAKTISVDNKKAHISPKACIRCFCCHEVCPVKAISVKRIKAFKL